MKRRKKYKINEDFFKEWTEDMAYVLGLWWADGCITIGRSYVFYITLNRKDEYLLKRILLRMSSSHRLYYNRNTANLAVNSETIVRDVIALGGMQRKSRDIGFPNLPKDMVKHFVRGYFDGDGSIFWIKYRSGYASNFASGSKKMIYSLNCVLKEMIPDFTATIAKHRRSCGKGFNYLLVISKNSTKRLRDFMYSAADELRLERKYVKHKENGAVNPSPCDKQFVSLVEFCERAKKFGLRTTREWYSFFKTYREKVIGMPSHPEVVYGAEWAGWRNVLALT